VRDRHLPLRIAVIEDDARYRRSLEILFERSDGFALGGSFGSAAPALDVLERASADATPEPWDLVLMDLDLPRMKGIEATRRVKARSPELPVVVLTVFEEPATILEAICAGADGYLLKKMPAPELLSQLRGIAAGGVPLTSRVARTVLDLLRANPAAQGAGAQPDRLNLTDREQEVLQCLVRGLAYKQAADTLGVSLDTVRTHVRAVYRKLQVHSVAEAVSRAIRDRLV
jgi:DNA-binding NarL/FixJ family response regulator